MSLSSFDLIAFNNKGLCNGKIYDPNGNSVEIYKNMLFLTTPIENPTLENEFNLIGSVNCGELDFLGFTIHSIRGPQDSIFVFIFCIDKNNEHIFMTGIGCPGYEDNIPRLIEFFEIDQSEWTDFGLSSIGYGDKRKGIEIHDNSNDFAEEQFQNLEDKNCIKKIGITCYNNKTGKEKRYFTHVKGNEDLLQKYIGITQETFNKFIKWFESLADKYPYYDFKNWIKIIRNTPVRRINQADLYRSKNFNNILSVISTPIGQAKDPNPKDDEDD